MKKVLISIRPEWVAKILNGEKTLEIRKSAPKDLPCEIYIYCTKGKPSISPFEFYENGRPPHIIGDEINGKVVAKFTLNKVERLIRRKIWGEYEVYGEHKNFTEISGKSCVSQAELNDYLRGRNEGYAWEISDLHRRPTDRKR